MSLFTRLFGFGAAPNRDVFRFHDGERWRLADPVEVWERLEAAGGDQLLKDIAPPAGPAPADLVAAEQLRAEQGAKRKAATAKLAEVACEAFGVEPLDDGGRRPSGMTVAERIRLVAEFVAYLRGLAVAARPKPVPPPSTASR